MIKRSLTFFAAACGMLVALVFGLGIFANFVVGLVGYILAIPHFIVVFATAFGGVAAVMFLLWFIERSRS